MPHGVRPVRGTRDPQKGRLVLHGWFTEPAPFVDGPLDAEAAAEALNAALDGVFEELEVRRRIIGLDGGRGAGGQGALVLIGPNGKRRNTFPF